MPDQNLPTTAITLQLHTETIDRVEAHELEPPHGRVVAVTFGDDQSGLHLIGDEHTVGRLLAQAPLAVIGLPHADRDSWMNEEHDFTCRVIHGLTADEVAGRARRRQDEQ